MRCPSRRTRDSECQRTARESTWASTSRPAAASCSGVVAVVDADHVLLDDRALVEVGGDVVGGRADQLHAAVEGLVVGPGALEARQERVVDVDRLARQPAAHVVGEHLHVAGEHDEVDAELLVQAHQLGLGLGLGLRGDRDVPELEAVGCAPAPRRRGGWRPRPGCRSAGCRCECRKSRSLRQCSCLLTMISVRYGARAPHSSKVISNVRATTANSSRRDSAVVACVGHREVDAHEEPAVEPSRRTAGSR